MNYIFQIVDDIINFRINSLLDHNQTRLNLSNLKIAQLPARVYEDPSIRPTSIFLHRNALTSLPMQLATLYKLLNLSIGNNCFTSFPAVLCELKYLTVLNISCNPIKELPPSIRCMKYLKVFWCNKIELEEIPKEIGLLTKLEIFGARGNRIRKVPNSFGQLHCLRYLFFHQIKTTAIYIYGI